MHVTLGLRQKWTTIYNLLHEKGNIRGSLRNSALGISEKTYYYYILIKNYIAYMQNLV